ncbi:DUF3043 domain-containing protein [Nocardioides speluncae]|uniref:DUF3043 domain-containing protein n=1 Tax=Nocardioides speluncae TaxID=2670337 RepID=UPI000D685491|nr:DUF3043 domain-containing protein [Nocardioides speluncae]
MFRRTKPETPAETESTSLIKEGGKGRPTPTRREAEAAARERARVPRDRKELARRQRATRTESSQKIRQAMKTGDERYLPARDKGPVRRFVRDFVDVRMSFVELMLPLLIVIMILGYSGNASAVRWSNVLLPTILLLVVVDLVIMRFRLRRELGRRFPDESMRGTTFYAISRALQMKFMRLPKAQVKFGQELPENYS